MTRDNKNREHSHRHSAGSRSRMYRFEDSRDNVKLRNRRLERNTPSFDPSELAIALPTYTVTAVCANRRAWVGA